MTPGSPPAPLTFREERIAGRRALPGRWARVGERTSFALIAATTFGLVALLLLIAGRAVIFGGPVWETTDFAANSLQINQAKHFADLLGNYSRFGFHHPGAAFLYVYAAGEALFHDALGLSSAPYNAQVLAGALLQAAFIAAAAVLASDLVGARARAPLLGLLIVAFFAVAGDPSLGLWPPYQLVGPFLCFLVAAVAVGMGRAAALPVLVIAAGFLGHGHAAQAMFILPIGALALLVAFARFGRSFVTSHRAAFMLAIAAAVPFALTLAIDLTRGADSNLAAIARTGTSGTNTPAEVLATIGMFLAMTASWSMIAGAAGPGDLLLMGAWTAVVALPLAILWRTRPATRTLIRTYAAIVGLASLLTVVWLQIQTPPVYAFNTLFLYAILACWLLPLGAIASVGAGRLPVVGLAAVAVAIVILAAPTALWTQAPLDDAGTGVDLQREAQALALDPRPKRLIFDEATFGHALGLALALDRDGATFLVPASWQNVFGQSHVDDGREAVPVVVE